MSRTRITFPRGLERTQLVEEAILKNPTDLADMTEHFDMLIQLYRLNKYEIYKISHNVSNTTDADRVQSQMFAAKCLQEQCDKIEPYMDGLYDTISIIDPDAFCLVHWDDVENAVNKNIAHFENVLEQEAALHERVAAKQEDAHAELCQAFQDLEISDQEAVDFCDKHSFKNVMYMAFGYHALRQGMDKEKEAEAEKDALIEDQSQTIKRIKELASRGVAGISDLFAYIEKV